MFTLLGADPAPPDLGSSINNLVVALGLVVTAVMSIAAWVRARYNGLHLHRQDAAQAEQGQAIAALAAKQDAMPALVAAHLDRRESPGQGGGPPQPLRPFDPGAST